MLVAINTTRFKQVFHNYKTDPCIFKIKCQLNFGRFSWPTKHAQSLRLISFCLYLDLSISYLVIYWSIMHIRPLESLMPQATNVKFFI